MEEYSVVCLTGAFFLCQSHNMPLHTFSLSFPRNRLLLPTLQSKHKTFSCLIVSQSPKYCSVLSPRQINHEKTASVCFLITSSYPHKHSETLWTVSEKGQNLPSTSNWNVPTEILSGYQLGYMCQAWHTDQMLHQREIQWLYPPSGRGSKESWNAAISPRTSLAYCTFQLNQCAFSFDDIKMIQKCVHTEKKLLNTLKNVT